MLWRVEKRGREQPLRRAFVDTTFASIIMESNSALAIADTSDMPRLEVVNYQSTYVRLVYAPRLQAQQ